MITIKHHITDFSKNLLGIPGVTCAKLGPHFWDDTDKLSDIENHSLEIPFTLDELKKAVFACEPHGALGPDGFTFKFYQSFWNLVKDDLFYYEPTIIIMILL